MNSTNEEPLATPPYPLAETPAPAATSKVVCANCGSELFGPHCYACGQPVKGMVRQLSSILADVFDTVLNIDSRIFRTLLPLYVRPGYLSTEYFAGRRVRYVTPFRLYFFLSVAAFLLIQIGLDSSLDLARDMVQLSSANTEIANARTAADVENARDAALAKLETAKAAPGLAQEKTELLDHEEQQVRKAAEKRLRKLADQPAAADPTRGENHENFNIQFNDQNWDAEKNPIHIGWLPDFLNAKLNNAAGRIKDNLPRIQKDPKPFLLGTFSVLPQVLFVLMPLFALLLKVFYLFKRRLYMEHLIVALHSHSFIYFALLLLTLLGLLRNWTNAAAPSMSGLLGAAIFVLGWWLPIYLLIMQKRVYRQGWFFTIVKYLLIGLCYTILVGCGVAVALVVSLATTN